MSSIAALERLLANEAALQQAQRTASYAQNTQQILSQPLSNFNAGSLRDPARVASLERLQASIQVRQYMESGTIRHAPAYNAPNSPALSSSGSGATTLNPSGAVVNGSGTPSPAAQTLTRPLNLPRQIQLPSTGQLVQNARSIAPSLARSLGSSLAIGLVQTGSQLLQSGLDDYNEQLGNQLPQNLQPAWDGIAGPNGFLERWLSPPQVSAAREGLRQLGDISRLQNGLPARSMAGGIAQQLTCSIFGVGCPSETEGIPNLGSPGAAPPFYGGQSPGVLYNVTIRYGLQNDSTGAYTSLSSFPETKTGIKGPITSIAVEQNDPLGLITNGSKSFVVIRAQPTTSAPTGITRFGGYFDSTMVIESRNILRADGQPDTGGNPAPSPTAENRPATAPPLANRQIFPPPSSPGLSPTTVPNPTQTPAPTNPTPPPGTGTPESDPPDSDRDSPFNPLNPNFPLVPAAMPVSPPSGARGFNPSGSPQPTTNPPSTRTTPGPQAPTCLYDSRNISGKVDQANATLQFVELYMQREMMSKLDTIDTKLGKQIPGGGISGFLDNMFNFAKKTWNFLQVDRVLNVLTWIGVLHNAFMLSNALGQSLFAMVSLVLDAFGIEDADGNAFDVGSVVSGWTESFFNNLLGEETVDSIQANWAKWNRIYQAASNLLYSIQSMFYSMAEILEVISNYVGRIGNALMKSGTILQNSFNWMNTNANFTDNRFFKFLQRTQDGVEIVEQIFSEVVSIQETAVEFQQQTEQFDKEFGKEEDAISLTENKAAEDQRTDIQITPIHETRAEGE